MIVFKWVPAELVFYFIILNILSFLFIFLYSKQLSDSLNKNSLKNFLFPIIPLTGSVLIGVMIGASNEPIQQTIKKIENKKEFINLNIWNEYLVILAFSGFILIHSILNRNSKKNALDFKNKEKINDRI